MPTVITSPVTYIMATTAVSGGEITGTGGSWLTANGVCWSKSHNPTIADSKTIDFGGSDSFVSNMTELTVNTTYFVRAYIAGITIISQDIN